MEIWTGATGAAEEPDLKRAIGIALGIVVAVTGIALTLYIGAGNRVSTGTTTALHEAAASGQLGGVRDRVEDGANINAPYEAGKTALHLAAEHGHGQTVSALLQLGADPTAKDVYGRTPSEYARQNGHTGTASRLIAQAEH